MPSAIMPLWLEARLALGLTQKDFAESLGSSERTGTRLARGHSMLSPDQMQELARRLYPIDPSLAARVATSTGTTLEALGLVRPAPPPVVPPPAPPPPRSPRVAEAVVCAAADVMDVPPRTIRPAVLAAFACAREVGLAVEEVERALGGKEIVAAAKKVAASGEAPNKPR